MESGTVGDSTVEFVRGMTIRGKLFSAIAIYRKNFAREKSWYCDRCPLQILKKNVISNKQ